jgi:hypothetical protein
MDLMLIYVFSKEIPKNTTIYYSTGFVHTFNSEIAAFYFNAISNRRINVTIIGDPDCSFDTHMGLLIDTPIIKVEYSK